MSVNEAEYANMYSSRQTKASPQTLGPEIVRGPENTTVYVNQSAAFTCETRGGAIAWKVNGTVFEELTSNDIKKTAGNGTAEGTTMETLTIPARAKYNGTRVQCLSVIPGVSSVESYNATLTIMEGVPPTGFDPSPVTVPWTTPTCSEKCKSTAQPPTEQPVTSTRGNGGVRIDDNSSSSHQEPTVLIVVVVVIVVAAVLVALGTALILLRRRKKQRSSRVVYQSSIGRLDFEQSNTDGVKSETKTSRSTGEEKPLLNNNDSANNTASLTSEAVGGDDVVNGPSPELIGHRFTDIPVRHKVGSLNKSHTLQLPQRPSSPIRDSLNQNKGDVAVSNKGPTEDYSAKLQHAAAETDTSRYVTAPPLAAPPSTIVPHGFAPDIMENVGVEKETVPTVVETSTSGVQPPIPEDATVQYQEIDIRATHKMATSELGPLLSNRPKFKGPPTVESVMSLLWGVAGRWKEIAEGLEFDEDLIDEIDTNNDMDEGCLQVCVEMWVNGLHPSWEKLSRALRDLGEVELARQADSEDQDPDVGGGTANFEVKPQESTTQGGGTATVASELSTPQNADDEVGESRGSKITMLVWDTKSTGKYDRPYKEPLVKVFKENCGHEDNVDSKSDDIINNDVIGNDVEGENSNIELSSFAKCMQEQCEKEEAAVFALGSVDYSVSALKVSDVHLVFDSVLPLRSKAMIHTRRATDAGGLAEVAAKLHSEGRGGGSASADKMQQAVECKTTQPRLTDGESQKAAAAGGNRVPSTVRKSDKRKKKKRKRKRSLSPPTKRGQSQCARTMAKSSGDMPLG